MVRSSSKIFLFVFVIMTLLLSSCGGGGSNNQGTQEVPGTGATSGAPTSETGAGTGVGTATTEATTAATTEATTVATTEATTGATKEATTAATTAATTEATTAAGGGTTTDVLPWKPEKIGGTVSVLAVWGGKELDNFNAVIKPFEDQTGIKVQYEGTRDLTNVLNTRIQGGNPPDLAGIPNPGQLTALATAGSLKPLDDILNQQGMQQSYDAGFLKLTQQDGKTYGIFTKVAVKSLVWYDPKMFDAKGYKVPTTWEELQALEQKIITDGKAPWCVGIDGGAGSGWPGTDWVEDIYLHQNGPDAYDKWVTHAIPWTDPTVKQAFETWGKIVTDPKMVYGGPQTVIATNFGNAFAPMFEADPGCYMLKQADFITSFINQNNPDLKAGTDYNFFQLPAVDPQYQGTLEVAGDLFGMFNDTPQARALIQYLVSTEAQSLWAKQGGYLSANKAVDPKNYPDQTTQQIATILTSAKSVRFDGSDLMPQAVNDAFSQAVLQYPAAPNTLDQILQTVEQQAASAYKK